MKYLIFISLSFLLIFKVAGQSLQQVQEEQQKAEKKLRLQHLELLKQAKQYIINGDLGRAKMFLKKVDQYQGPLSLAIANYEAIIAFIEEDYLQSLNFLDDYRLSASDTYPQICLLKILNMLITRQTKNIEKEFASCNVATDQYSKNDQLWLQLMNQIHHKERFTSVSYGHGHYMNADNEKIKIWLKSALFTNQEDKIKPLLNNFHESIYHSKSIRELIGMIHYRTGNPQLAQEFIDDINSVNAENIKGNINLEKKEYELAFGHFKLALQHKENSQNALERSIPLAWMLEQWNDGIDFLERIVTNDDNEKQLLTLETAFNIRQKKYLQAHKQLLLLQYLFKGKLPKEVLLMSSYISTVLAQKQDSQLYAYEACRKFDGLNCWLLGQNLIWDNFGKTIMRNEKTLGDNNIDIAQLKTAGAITPLEEKTIINQKDIEELDSTLIAIEPQ